MSENDRKKPERRTDAKDTQRGQPVTGSSGKEKEEEREERGERERSVLGLNSSHITSSC